MAWQIRHQGSPKAISGLTLNQIIEGLRDGRWEPTDEVKGPADRQWLAIENHPQLAEVAAELEAPAPPHLDETHLDMNALIDVCLVLLIFFILTTTHAAAIQKVVPVPTVTEDPKGKTGVRIVTPDQVKKHMIRVDVTRDAKDKWSVRVQGQPADVLTPGPTPDEPRLDGPKLTSILRTYVQSNPLKTELLLDAQHVSWGLVVAIQDAARAAGVQRVHHLNKRQQTAAAG
jgi:biopolymer transport protein ExbD